MILFFYGANSYASRRQLQEIVGTYLAKTGSDLGLERIEGATADLKSLIGAIRAVPFLSTSRLVIIEYLSANKSVAAQIDKIVEDVPATTVVVFYEKEVDKRTALFKTLTTKAKAQEFGPLSPAQLGAWVMAEATKLGGSIERADAMVLIDRVGEDQWQLEQELIKLVSYQPTITANEIETIVEPAREDNIFALIEAVAAGDTKQALDLYQDILASGASEMYVLSMIIWQLRNLLLAKTAGTIPPAVLAKEAGLSPYVATKASARHRAFSEEQLKVAFLEAVDTEYKIKTGAGKPQELIELLIYKVTVSPGR